jgi:redox-sensitive bicupin YhaK (pirin superfamily)
MYNKIITGIKPLGFMWETRDPFLFCVHHQDAYPAGNPDLGPATSLAGRNIGQDFTLKDGWRMYHGHKIPGFPVHPHRGFETVTIVLNGMVDHSDSHGSSGRYGNGDVQWMTAGSGLQHSEMFPLLNTKDGNPMELYQIWLNLPGAKKFSTPFYTMLWAEDIPIIKTRDSAGKLTEIKVIAGKIGEISAPPPAPDSWAADPGNEVAILILKMDDHATYTIPAASAEVNRTLYFCKGSSIHIAGVEVANYNAIELLAEQDAVIENGAGEGYFLLLQGKPIGEPVVQHGPFVMNTREEIYTAIHDYQKDQFGGWPWPRPDMVHGPSAGRFAKFADGKQEIK